MNFNNAKEIKVSGGGIEIWKPIIGFEGLYEISNYGRIASLERLIKRGRIEQLLPYKIIKPQYNLNYLFNNLSKNGVKKMFTIHRLVAIHFLPESEITEQVNHIDGIKTNNYYKNLEWCDSFKNVRHALENRLISKRITPKETRVKIITLFNSGVKHSDLVKQTGVPSRTLLEILKKYKNGENVIY